MSPPSAEELVRRQRRRMEAAGGLSGLTPDALQAYDFGVAVAGALDPAGLRGFEAEVSQELARQLSGSARISSSPGAVLIPPSAALNTGEAGGGAELIHPAVPSPVRPALRPSAVVERLGATVIRDAPSGVRLLRVSSGLELVWIDQELPADDHDETVPSFVGEPIPIRMARVDTWASRQLHRQAPELRAILGRDVRAAAVALLDQAAIAGSGTDGEPTGILVADGVTPVNTGGTLTWEDLLEMEEAAHEDGQVPGWVTTKGVRRFLRNLPEIGSGGSPAWRNGRVLDAPAFVSSHVPSDPEALVYSSSWPDLVVQILALELVPDPYTLAARGIVRLRVFLHAGVGLWEPGPFVKATGIVLPGEGS